MSFNEFTKILSDETKFINYFFLEPFKKYIKTQSKEYSEKEIELFKKKVISNLEKLNKNNNLIYLLRPIGLIEVTVTDIPII